MLKTIIINDKQYNIDTLQKKYQTTSLKRIIQFVNVEQNFENNTKLDKTYFFYKVFNIDNNIINLTIN
jgi:hypothetical protein